MVLRINWKLAVCILLSIAGCSLQEEPEPLVVFVTATPSGDVQPETVVVVTSASVAAIPTTATRVDNQAREYTIQSGDTLFGIALAHNISVDTLIELNRLSDPNVITVGQVLQLPGLPDNGTPGLNIIADSRLVRGPGSTTFDVSAFINQQPGYIRTASDKITNRQATGFTSDEFLNANEIVIRVSTEFSVDPRLLLALLEYRAGWLSNPNPADEFKTHPMISEEDSEPIDRSGLYRQLAWTANELNRGYYGYKYEGWNTIEFEDGERLRFAEGINPSTAALHHFLHLHNTVDRWYFDVDTNGFFKTYSAYFGNPLADEITVTVPSGLIQPDMTFPFSSGEVWYFTGGPHGGWGNGSAWAAVDFAPPDERREGVACYISEYPVTAVAAGVIARSEKGTVVLDLDGDGDETTGWTVLYLHLTQRIAAGRQVQTGDALGFASCEGGFSTATHMHIARRYNGEWLPTYCHVCRDIVIPPLNFSGWTVIGYQHQEYQGYMHKDGEQRIAEQGRNIQENRVSW